MSLSTSPVATATSPVASPATSPQGLDAVQAMLATTTAQVSKVVDQAINGDKTPEEMTSAADALSVTALELFGSTDPSSTTTAFEEGEDQPSAQGAAPKKPMHEVHENMMVSKIMKMAGSCKALAGRFFAMLGYALATLLSAGLFFAIDYAVNNNEAVEKRF